MTLDTFLAQWLDDSPTLTVHTSGSTGRPKAILVEKERMRASARMTCDFLGLRPGETALLCMPLDYIAGKMMVVRARERQLRLICVPPSGHPLAQLPPEAGTIDFAAMVPLQVWNTLQVPAEAERLRTIRHLLIGGGSIDPELEAMLRHHPHAVWSSYGMTETLSHIALRRIDAGTGTGPCADISPDAQALYTPLPGVSLSVDEHRCLVIDAPHLCPQVLHTHDIVQMHEEGRFRILGRLDNVICSGGIKIQIEEVEACLRPAFGDTIQVTAAPHPKYGELVVYLSTAPVDEHLLRLCVPNPYWLPRRIIPVRQLPLTETGKPDRARARAIARGEEV